MIVVSIYKPWILDLHSLHIHADQLGGEFWQLINPFRPSKLDDDVLALDIAEVVQARPQGLNPARRSSSRAETQVADARDRRRLLRARCERPRCYRAAKQRDELSPFHGQLHQPKDYYIAPWLSGNWDARKGTRFHAFCFDPNVSCGSWLCENSI
jgi:hypothetical protein